MKSMEVELFHMRMSAKNTLQDMDVSYLNSFDDAYLRFQIKLKSVDLNDLSKDIEKEISLYKLHYEKLLKMVSQKLEKSQIKSFMKNNLDQVGPRITLKLKELSSELEKKQDQIGPLVTYFSFFSLFITLIFILFYVKKVIKINKDLTRYFQQTTDKIQEVFQSLKGMSAQLKHSMNVNLNYGKKVKDNAHTQSAALSQSVASLHELDITIKHNFSLMKENNSKLEEMLILFQNIIKEVTHLVEQFDSLEKKQKMSSEEAKSLKSIEESVEKIEDIVFQTKILSFNANVESARAGEKGKGFGVVAQEMIKLASFSEEISATIRDHAQLKSTSLQSSILEVSQSFLQTKDKLMNTSSVLQELELTSQRVGEMNGELVQSSKEQETSSKELSQAVRELEVMNNDNLSSINSSVEEMVKLLNESEKMFKACENLEELISHKHQNVA